MLTKKTILLISATIFVLLFTFFSFYLYKSTLIIKSIDKEKTIYIDDDIYKNVKEELKITVKPGKHKIVINLDNYNNYETDILIKPFEKKEITINLTETNESIDKQSIEDVSKKFVESYNTYSKQTDQEYFDRIKPYMEEDFFESEKQLFLSNPNDYLNQSAVSAAMKKITITKYSPEEATVVVNYTKTIIKSNKLYELNNTLLVSKNNNKWLVYAIK